MKQLTIYKFALIAILISACANTASKTITPATPSVAASAAAPTNAPLPTTAPTPTSAPLGSAANPIFISLPPATSAQEIINSGELLAKQLSDLSGLTIQTNTPATYNALIEAMGANKTHVGYYTPFAYVAAQQKANVELGLVAVRNNTDRTSILFITNAAAKYTLAKDDKEIEVLKQFVSKKPCWTETTAAAGYVIPLGILNKQNIKFRTGAAFLQGDTTVVKAVYFSARADLCDFGAVLDDARLGALKDYFDVREKVVVTYKTEPLIPHNVLVFAKELPNDIRSKISEALLKVAQTEDGKKNLRAVYQIEGLKIAKEDLFTNFRVYLEASGIELNTLFK